MKQQIKRKSLSEEVADRLQVLIQSEAYKLGQQLPTEPELMKDFGVGRSSIREAIRILENAGMLRVQQGLGTFVASKTAAAEPLARRLDLANQQDITEVRDLLEAKIVQKAAMNRSAKDLVKIKDCLVKRNTAADRQQTLEWLEADIDFHLAIAEACKNPVLTELYKTFAEQQLKRSIAANYKEKPFLHRLTAFHEQLVNAIEIGDPDMAEKAMYAMRKG